MSAARRMLLAGGMWLLASTTFMHCECGESHFAPPMLEVDSTVLLFEDVAVGWPQTRILTISNKGGSGLTL